MMHTWDDLYTGIKVYSEQDEDSPHHVAFKTYEKALETAKSLEAFNFPVPRIFCHSGDAIVFIWGEVNSILEPKTNNKIKPLQVFITITDDGPGKLVIRNA